MSQQLQAMGLAILCGVIIGALYDCFRLVRVFFGITEYARIGHRLYRVDFPLIGTVERPDVGKFLRVAQFWVVLVGDLLFAVLSGCIFSVFIYAAASGCFRWFYLFFACVGFLLYYFTVGHLVMTVSDVISCVLRVCFRYIQYFLMLPFRLLRSGMRLVWRQVLRRMLCPIERYIHTQHCRRYTSKMKKNLYTQIRVS